jgi:hypothetical protein
MPAAAPLLGAIGAVAPTDGNSSPPVKWHPGHYVMVEPKTEQSEYLHPGFRGILKLYSGKPPQPGADPAGGLDRNRPRCFD